MRAIWKGSISFGLVSIPIALGLATQRSDPRFRTLDAEGLQPIRQQLFSPARDEVIERDETVKGYEIAKDRYLPISDEELESVSVEARRTIDIIAFVELSEVDPVYYDRTYYLEPQERAEKPYALLLEALKQTGRAALGKIVLSSKEYLALLRPSGDALVVELLFYPEDVRSKAEIEERVRETEIKEPELDMATQLVDSLARPFDPDEFENEHKRDVMALIERKMEGEEVPLSAPEPAAPVAVPDLMAALKASLDESKSTKRRGGGTKRETGGAKRGAGGAKSGNAAGAKSGNGSAKRGASSAKAKPRKRASAKTS